MSKRICVFGNMNNYPLLLTEGFRAIGVDAHLYLLRGEQLHRPESKYPDLSNNYPHWIVDCSQMSFDDVVWETAAYMDVLSRIRSQNFDYIIANDYGIGLSDAIGRPHAVLLTGSDLTYFGDFASIIVRRASWDPNFARSYRGRAEIKRFTDFIARQRSGLLGAEVFGYPPRGLIPEGDDVIDAIGIADERRHWIGMADTLSIVPSELPATERLRILNGTRLQWIPTAETKGSSLDLKGTDILLHGFAQYVHAGGSGELILVRKGHDVEAAAELVRQLGIGTHVSWLGELSLADYVRAVQDAHIVCEHLGGGAPGMVLRDGLAQGRPVLGNLRNDVFGRLLPEPIPGLDARTPGEVAAHLQAAERDRDALCALARRGRAFAEAYLSPQENARRILELMG
ncbi:hypothetical protein LOK46_06220 [Methylobacterium sp. NMS14P]|uniref:hypothetical protein n=1 Tax=Methylobacterium sp. NMS14P TaxID=2894310 RepID=UPI00235A301B|nr:hypothetical protein [Methylobacterium sp. NMS14P]WCS26428.1 hypothetical protein LOK46_06220 [Methylobacterium sp. NMS14P]